MSLWTELTRSVWVRCLAGSLLLGSLAACGGGDVAVGVGVAIPVQPPVVAPLTMVLTRVGPADIAVDWSDDPRASHFVVLRDGFALASTATTTSLIDSSVLINGTYCYQVQGYDPAGLLVASSSIGCITVFP